jgi:hypothetical protein
MWGCCGRDQIDEKEKGSTTKERKKNYLVQGVSACSNCIQSVLILGDVFFSHPSDALTTTVREVPFVSTKCRGDWSRHLLMTQTDDELDAPLLFWVRSTWPSAPVHTLYRRVCYIEFSVRIRTCACSGRGLASFSSIAIVRRGSTHTILYTPAGDIL